MFVVFMSFSLHGLQRVVAFTLMVCVCRFAGVLASSRCCIHCLCYASNRFFAFMVLSGLSLDRRWVVSGLSLYRLAFVVSMGSSGSVAFAFMGCACVA